MAQRRHHYERAFEAYLRTRRIPYVAVDEARKALLPHGAAFKLHTTQSETPATLKSFDFVVYAETSNLLVDIKGRRVASRSRGGVSARLESWVTEDDVDSLAHWRRLFGDAFDAAFVFVYACDEQPPDALFQEIFEHQDRWYALRSVDVDAYRAHMKQRSPRWRTVHVPTAEFEMISRPFAPAPSAATLALAAAAAATPAQIPAIEPFH